MRKPALLAATVALAIAPALTSLTPAFAAVPTPPPANPCLGSGATPAPTPTTAPGNTPLIELILDAFPNPVQCDARAVLAGQFTMLLPLISDMLHLTPTQLQAVLTKLQGLAGLLPGGGTPTPTPTPTSSAAAAADVALEPVTAAHKPKPKPKHVSLTAKQKAELRALLAQIKGGKLTAPEAVHILLIVGLTR